MKKLFRKIKSIAIPTKRGFLDEFTDSVVEQNAIKQQIECSEAIEKAIIVHRINEIEKIYKITIENAKKIINLLGYKIPLEIDLIAQGWIKLSWDFDEYVFTVKITDTELLLEKTNMENPSDKFYANILFSDFCEETFMKLLDTINFLNFKRKKK